MQQRLSINTPASGELGSALSPQACVDQRDEWPVWRRWLRIPDDGARARRSAWRALSGHIEIHAKRGQAVPALPRRTDGIFNRARVPLHLLDYAFAKPRTFSARGVANVAPHVTRDALRLELTRATKVEAFECDMNDVEGLGASKSSTCSYPDLRAFGRSFQAYKGFALDECGLAQAIAHSEIRVVHSPGADPFSIFLWDGRLFLENAGGSHHFAAAAYIASAMGKAIPLRAPLWVYQLNERLWADLLADYRVLLVPSHGFFGGAWVAELCGHCHELEMPRSLADGGRLVFLPRKARLVDLVVELLRAAAVTEVTDWWAEQLQLQRENRLRLQRTWPVLAQVLGGDASS